MVNLTLIKILRILCLPNLVSKPGRHCSKRTTAASHYGFTLLELLVVILIIGVLTAIAAPSWLAFTNRQRVSAVNDSVFRAVQNAQQEAKRRKQSFNVSFRTKDKEPQFFVYAQGYTPIETDWKLLRKNLDIKPGQVLLCSNINQAQANKTDTPDCNFLEPRTITFDYRGNLPIEPVNPDPNLTITVSVPQTNSPTSLPIKFTNRCVIVTTLLGSMRIDQGEYEAATLRGCPSP